MRVDGYSYHEHKKRGLQVSKGKGWYIPGEQDKSKTEVKGGLTRKAPL
jgi:hypothetical protein